ncbi:hypothetical protein ACRRTK_007768 [Alexandromys fortis]
MAASSPEGVLETQDGKRRQFGNRFLSDPARVFHYNAWDNVEWSEAQAAAAERKVQENSSQRVCPEKQVDYEVNAHKYWNDFYKIHENGFFKDRHWLFTEFPELAPSHNPLTDLSLDSEKSEVSKDRSGEDGLGFTTERHGCSWTSCGCDTQGPPVEETVTRELSHLEICADEFPGSSATYRILEVTFIFLIMELVKTARLNTSNPNLFVYCCDFSATAIELVKTNSEYDPSRCFAFVHDLCDEDQSYPMPEGSLDVVVLIFVLSAIVPDKMQKAISRLSRLLKPGGVMLLRDYGRYDMAQLRFKKDELHALFTAAGLEKVQNLVDRRLQVNRGKQLTMYRVWIQCKYSKPLLPGVSREVPVPHTT